mmetsp:Transcript_29533/g.81139  ORF Transcript_29533/g.81139 Transcript_29533/m.81139 type:complete len:295 (-) Transcript_29533:12-896(-)
MVLSVEPCLALGLSALAFSSAMGSTRSVGHAVTTPCALRLVAVKRSPRTMKSWRSAKGRRAAIKADMPGLYVRPRSTPGTKQKPRSAFITHLSKQSMSIAPAAHAWPLTAATVGFGKRRMRAQSNSVARCRSSARLACRCKNLRSNPLEKYLPSAVRITAATLGSSSAASSARSSANTAAGYRRCSAALVPQGCSWSPPPPRLMMQTPSSVRRSSSAPSPAGAVRSRSPLASSLSSSPRGSAAFGCGAAAHKRRSTGSAQPSKHIAPSARDASGRMPVLASDGAGGGPLRLASE